MRHKAVEPSMCATRRRKWFSVSVAGDAATVGDVAARAEAGAA